MIPPARPRRLPLCAALAVAALVAALVFTHLRLRTDMTDFMPAGHSQAARLMVQELRSGAATTLILVGIEGAPPAELARLSTTLADAARRSGLFRFVANGKDLLSEADTEWLFHRRYLLSPATTPAAFTAPALHRDFQRLLDGLRSSASPLVARFGLADPTGAFLALLRDWDGGSRVRTRDGVWFAGDRALLVVRTKAGGLDLAAQDRAIAALHAAFAEAHPGGVRLLLTGPAVFARDAARAIRADVRLISIASALLVALLLIWRFRSPWVLAAIAVPVVLSISAAALAVQLAFGFVHGIALGFGMTMLGVTVDYPVLLVGHRKQGEAAPATLRRIGPAFNMAVATAALGLTGMTFSSFPGLAQLGLFSVTGVLAAAACTRWLLPRLIVAADLAPVWAGDPGRLLRVERLRRWRAWGLLPVGAAALCLLVTGGPRREGDLAALSPVPAHARALDAELRAEIGAPGAGQLLIVRGDTAEAVLRREEALAPTLQRLARDGTIARAEDAAQFLPSAQRQRARQQALPPPDMLAARVAAARQGLPFRETAFQGFRDDVEASRRMAPVRPADLTGAAAERLAPLLFTHQGHWFGVVAPQGVADPARFAAAFDGTPWVSRLDMRAETNGLLARATRQAWWWLAGGGAAVLVALLVGLRDTRRAARVAGAIGAALLVTVAVLTLSGARLSLIHLVALQFVAGVGLDYALFFSRPQLDAEERSRTLRTLVTCNAMSLLTFGLLALCRTPLLREIGDTVALGVFAAMIFAFLFAGVRPARDGAA